MQNYNCFMVHYILKLCRIKYMKIEKFKLEEWMNEYEASALYDLTTTCISPLCINEFSFSDEIFNIKLGYGDITGSKRLKKAIKSLYENNDKDVTVTHGAIGANQLVFLSLLERGDEVVSIVPTYQQHYSIPKALGCNVKLYFLKEDNNWLPNLEELDKIVTQKTKLLCLNNPNNPTGSVIPDNMLENIVNIAKNKDVWILADEVYRGLNLEGNAYSKSIADIYDKGISVGSMSKTYSLPGLRVGWVVARNDLVNEINHQRQYNTISISPLDDYFAAIALEQRAGIEKRNFKILNNRLNILRNWLDINPKVSCILPKGGTTVLLKYGLNIPSKEFCKNLQQETGVALLPGETLEMEHYVRLGFCAENLEPALNILADYIKR